jgi:nitrite reductase/ring-hydroxylating ferredoxin subunit
MERTQRGLLRRGFDEILLTGVILVIVTGIVILVSLYVMPSEHLEIPELQPVIRISQETDFPVGTSRVRNWGQRTILIVRADSASYYALQGASPADGCLLRWDPESTRVYSPCRYSVYGLRGEVVAGLSTRALTRYAVSVRDGVIYVSEAAR